MLDLGPRPLLGYIANPLDRAADRRDDGWLSAHEANAGAYLIGGELVVLRKASEPQALFGLAEARALAPVRETDTVRAQIPSAMRAQYRFANSGCSRICKVGRSGQPAMNRSSRSFGD